MYIDLHTHTTCSDGTLTPEALIQYAKAKNLKAVAVTDHDTVSGNLRALKEGEALQLEVIPGVELSAAYTEGSLHILGLFVDSRNKAIRRATEKLQEKRRERNIKILRKLNELGIEIERSPFVENAYLGRPHIGRALCQLGYVESIDEAFEKYLKKGASAYVVREKLSEEETIKAIVAAGGLPVLAHPVTVFNAEKTVTQLLPLGLRGIEVYYPTHSPEDVHSFQILAEKYNLLMTGGSDFHGEHKPKIDLGCMKVPASLLEPLKNEIELNRRG